MSCFLLISFSLSHSPSPSLFFPPSLFSSLKKRKSHYVGKYYWWWFEVARKGHIIMDSLLWCILVIQGFPSFDLQGDFLCFFSVIMPYFLYSKSFSCSISYACDKFLKKEIKKGKIFVTTNVRKYIPTPFIDSFIDYSKLEIIFLQNLEGFFPF